MVLVASTLAQQPKKYTSSEILLKLKKLNVLGTALYVAAHPDDENTRMIGYLANERLVNAAYLSVTRGDGGQNEIGTEIRELLGVIRTQELLAARRTDGGQQFFTRANDFGYSKTAEETQKFWDRDAALGDVVWVIRNYRPDVIITRFPPDKRAGHGQHTTSAIFAEEAFDLVGDKTKYPEQLQFVETWQPKRHFLNTGRWWNREINKDTPGVISVDVGTYNPYLGKSTNEIAALSRSKHRSQGFGAIGTRGSQIEFLELKKGEPATNDIFDGIDISWNRVKGGSKIGAKVEAVIANFDHSNPASIVTELLSIRSDVAKLKDEFWKNRKLKDIDELIRASLGLYIEMTADDHYYSSGDSIKLRVEAINRSAVPVSLVSINLNKIGGTESVEKPLEHNQRLNLDVKRKLGAVESFEPYWLQKEGSLGMYAVGNQQLIGSPENAAVFPVHFNVDVAGTHLSFETPVVYKWRDPRFGEKYRPIVTGPPVFVDIEKKVYILANEQPSSVKVRVKSGKLNIAGQVKLQVPAGWKVTPEQIDFAIENKSAEETYEFMVQPPAGESRVELGAVATYEGQNYSKGLTTITYDHIPTQTIFPKARAIAAKLDIERRGENIGYIMGGGDEVNISLEQIGYNVWNMNDDEVTAQNLKGLDAVVLGVRALNLNERIGFQMPILLDYVKNGGTLIIQFSKFFGMKTQNYAPFPFKISRDRVAEEDAAMRILEPDHPIFNYPNKIEQTDFDNWVQERGLYFSNEWSEEYTPLLSSNDTDENAKNGGLLVAKYGQGYYIYTGYSWFRQLPAGVPGAYKIFTNMISIGKKEPAIAPELGDANK